MNEQNPATLARSRLAALVSRLRPFAPVLFGSALNGFAAGALSVLIGVRLAANQDSAMAVAVVLACYFAGLIVGCRWAPRIVAAMGHVRAFAAFTSILTCLALAHVLFVSVPAWGVLRFGTGLCMAGTFTVIESWLNQEVASTFRGRIFAVYIIFSSGAASVAPLSLSVIDPFGDHLFLVIAMAYALAPLGMMVRLPRVPVIEGRVPLRLSALFAISPGGMLACFGHGLVNSALYQVSPVYFHALGFGPGLLSVFLSAAMFAGVLMQAPIGAVGDRFARHHLLLAMSLLTATAALPLAIVTSPPYAAVLVAGVAFGACAQSFYGLGVAITNDRLANLDFVGAAGGLLLAWAAGAALGPIISAALMDAIGPFGLFVYLCAVPLVLAGVVLQRMLVRPLPSPSPTPPTGPTRG